MTSQSSRGRLSMKSHHCINLTSRNHCPFLIQEMGDWRQRIQYTTMGCMAQNAVRFCGTAPYMGWASRIPLKCGSAPDGSQLASRTSWFGACMCGREGVVSDQSWANQSPSLVFATGRMSLIERWQMWPALFPTFGEMQFYSKHGAGTQRETEARLGSQ